MNPATLFEFGSMLALAGWAALILGILTGRAWLRVNVASRIVPIALSVFYATLAAIA